MYVCINIYEYAYNYNEILYIYVCIYMLCYDIYLTQDVSECFVAAVFEGIKCAQFRPVLRPVDLGAGVESSELLDRSDPWTNCHHFCSALADRPSFDWSAFSLGLVCGAILFGVIELLLAVKAVVQTFLHRLADNSGGAQSAKPLYKLL